MRSLPHSWSANNLKENNMKHLVLNVNDGWIGYRMGDQMGSHPIGDDDPLQVIAYLVRITRATSHEVHYPKK